jgi:hypothetical protein
MNDPMLDIKYHDDVAMQPNSPLQLGPERGEDMNQLVRCNPLENYLPLLMNIV